MTKESGSARVGGILACSSILSVSNLLLPDGPEASLCARVFPEKAGAVAAAVWSPLNSDQKFHFGFFFFFFLHPAGWESQGLYWSTSLSWSAVYPDVSVKADLKSQKAKKLRV